jgi:hypothetical protein
METFTLIELWGEEDVEKELSGVHRNRHVYEKLSYRMKEHGYLRAWDAIRNKLKSLRFGYMKAKQQNTTSGQGRSKFPYFDQIDVFIGTQPLTRPDISFNAGSELEDKIAEAEEGLSLTVKLNFFYKDLTLYYMSLIPFINDSSRILKKKKS